MTVPRALITCANSAWGATSDPPTINSSASDATLAETTLPTKLRPRQKGRSSMARRSWAKRAGLFPTVSNDHSETSRYKFEPTCGMRAAMALTDLCFLLFPRRYEKPSATSSALPIPTFSNTMAGALQDCRREGRWPGFFSYSEQQLESSPAFPLLQALRRITRLPVLQVPMNLQCRCRRYAALNQRCHQVPS